jgi:hypothetical protein
MSDKQTAKIGKGKPGPGRKKGVPNKLTQSAKQAFQHAFDTLGGAQGLARWARSEPGDFYRLYARLIPVEQRLTDGNGEQLSIKVTFAD